MTTPANEPSMKLEWKFDARQKVWLTGSPDEGCGVLFDDTGWFANVVFDGHVTLLGPEETKEEAMEEAEKEFLRQKSENSH